MKGKIVILAIIGFALVIYFSTRPTVYVLENEEDAKWQLLNGYIEDGFMSNRFGSEGYYFMGDEPIEVSSYSVSYYFLNETDTSDRFIVNNGRISSSEPIVFNYGEHSHSKGYSGITMPGNEYDRSKIIWEISYEHDGAEVIDTMVLVLNEGQKPEHTQFDPTLTTKTYLVSENSDPMTDLIFLGQSIDEALVALEDEGIAVNYITEYENTDSPNYGGRVINLGLFSDVMISYTSDGMCYAITSYGYNMASGLEIGDSLFFSKSKIPEIYSRDNDENMVVFRSKTNNVESYITFVKDDYFGKELHGWVVHYTGF